MALRRCVGVGNASEDCFGQGVVMRYRARAEEMRTALAEVDDAGEACRQVPST